MPTDIYFATGGDKALKLRVDEEPNSVYAHVLQRDGMPFAATSDGKKVYVNPATIAYWREHVPLDPDAFRVI